MIDSLAVFTRRLKQLVVRLVLNAGDMLPSNLRGDGRGGMYLVEGPQDVDKLRVKDPEHLAFVTQTTLSMDDTAEVIDALRVRFPAIKGPKKDDICYATQNRQDAVKTLASNCDVFIVVGSPNSSNSNRLRELASKLGDRAYLVDNADELNREWFDGADRVGITAGASAPEILVQAVLTRLKAWGGSFVEEKHGKQERVVFSLPKTLARDAESRGHSVSPSGTDG